MLSKTFLCGLSLFLVVYFQLAASKYEIDSLLPTHPRSTLADPQRPIDHLREYSLYKDLTEFQFSLLQITAAAYRFGCSNELADYLFDHLDAPAGFSPPTPELNAELYSLLNHMIADAFQIDNLNPANTFTILAPAPKQTTFHAFVTPDRSSFLEPFSTHCGCRLATFYELPKIEYTEIRSSTFCNPWKYRRSAAAILPDPNPPLEPDLNLEFLNILNNPDDRVF